MRNATLPVLTVLTVIAVAGGFQLGETAIAQIDPLYFEGAASPARDVTRDSPRDRTNAYAAASGWKEGYAARTVDCGDDCPRALVDPTLGPSGGAALISYSDPTIEPRWERVPSPRPEEVLLTERSEESGRVGRYLHYPVSADQAEIHAALDGEAETLPPEPNGL